MKRICAWHKKNFGFELVMGEADPLDDKGETSGICETCVMIDFPDTYGYRWHDRPCLIKVKPVFKKGIKRNAVIEFPSGEKISVPWRSIRKNKAKKACHTNSS